MINVCLFFSYFFPLTKSDSLVTKASYKMIVINDYHQSYCIIFTYYVTLIIESKKNVYFFHIYLFICFSEWIFERAQTNSIFPNPPPPPHSLSQLVKKVYTQSFIQYRYAPILIHSSISKLFNQSFSSTSQKIQINK